MYFYQVSLYMYKYFNKLLPNVLYNFKLNTDIHSHFTRQSDMVHVVYCRTKTRQGTLQYQGLKIWNKIPIDTQRQLSFQLFKKSMKNVILNVILISQVVKIWVYINIALLHMMFSFF